jgi:hypothetical protein
MSKFTKKRAVVAVCVVAALAGAAGAFAYFTSTGTGTGQAAVGSATQWGVTFGTTTGTMYPGAGTATLPYTVTNNGTGNEKLATTTSAVASDGSGNVTSHGTAVTGCLATWFATVNTPPAAVDLAAAAHTTGTVAVTMADAAVNQNVCQGVTPDITVSAN